MSFLSGNKPSNKDKDPFSKKSQFYVEFLGWMECRGIRGSKYADPVIRELRRRQRKQDRPPKLTIQVSRKDLKISQDIEEKKKRNIKKIKFPAIPARDVTYVHQATRSKDGRLDDIVACIYLGYMPRTQRFVHVHVYRFDEASTAATFVQQMTTLVDANREHIRDVEIELANKGEIEDPRLTSSDGMSEPLTTDSAVGSTSSAYSDESPTFDSDHDIDPDLQSLHDVQPFDNVADEFKFRLQMGDSPLLLPPKDYDTISRAHGNLNQIDKRRCLNLNIVGEGAVTETRDRNGSSESGVDMASPISDLPLERSPVEVTPSPKVPHKPLSSRVSDPIHSGSSSPRPQSPANFVYPPKVNGQGLNSPKLFRAGPAHILSRQSSEGSRHSDYEPRDIIYKGGPINNNDIYALPFKGTGPNVGGISPRDELPPDYGDEDDGIVEMRGQTPRHRTANLTRSMPADLIRSEMALGNSRPINGELRNFTPRPIDAPMFVGGHPHPHPHPHPHHHPHHHPHLGRINSSNR